MMPAEQERLDGLRSRARLKIAAARELSALDSLPCQRFESVDDLMEAAMSRGRAREAAELSRLQAIEAPKRALGTKCSSG